MNTEYKKVLGPGLEKVVDPVILDDRTYFGNQCQKIFEDIIKSVYQLIYNVQHYQNIVSFVNKILKIHIEARVKMKFIKQFFLAFVKWLILAKNICLVGADLLIKVGYCQAQLKLTISLEIELSWR